jgi:hypothetical protein
VNGPPKKPIAHPALCSFRTAADAVAELLSVIGGRSILGALSIP